MFCTKCGSVLKEDAKFCTTCGEAVDGSGKKNVDKVERNLSIAEKRIIAVLLAVIMIGIGVIIALLIMDNTAQDAIKENETVKETIESTISQGQSKDSKIGESKIWTEDDSKVEEQTQTYLEETMDSNEMGNTSINMYLNGGRFASKDGWTYYTSGYDIKKIDASGSIVNVQHENKELSGGLNIVGEWIYYRYDGGIARVKTDGTMREIILSGNASSWLGIYPQMLVKGEIIYYVSSDQVSASHANKVLHKYNVATGENLCIYDFGEKTNVGMLGIYNNALYIIDSCVNESGRNICYVAPIYADNCTADYWDMGNAVFYASDQERIICMTDNLLLIQENTNLVALDLNEASNSLTETYRYNDILGVARVTKVFFENYINYEFSYYDDGTVYELIPKEVSTDDYTLCSVPKEFLFSCSNGQEVNWNNVINKIFNDGMIRDVYIHDGFVYYVGDSVGDVLCRVKLDGTGWTCL